MKDNKARFRKMLDQRRKTNTLYVDENKAKAQMDFYKGAIDAQKQSEQNSK